jgi:hypothetical protein
MDEVKSLPKELRRVDELLKPTAFPDVYRVFKEIKALIDMIAEKMGEGKDKGE